LLNQFVNVHDTLMVNPIKSS